MPYARTSGKRYFSEEKGFNHAEKGSDVLQQDLKEIRISLESNWIPFPPLVSCFGNVGTVISGSWGGGG